MAHSQCKPHATGRGKPRKRRLRKGSVPKPKKNARK